MKSSVAEPAVAAQATLRRSYPEIAGFLLLALALLFNAILLAPELRIERVPVNDLPFHIGASLRLGEAIAHGEPFLDPWVSQWALGFPLWRIYQPLPHLVAATVIALCRPFASPVSAFAAFYYLLLVLVPASVYLGARLMGLNPLAAGLASILVLTPNEGGDFGRYGLSYGAYVWRGSGLYTELFAIEVMLPALGLVAYAIDSGKRQIAAALGLALTALSHIFFGYVAFVSTAVWALVSPRDERPQRVARAVSIAVMAMLLLAWFVVPMLLAGGEVNRSRWDPAYKFDSYGAPIILGELFSGRLLDFERFPVLSLMVALGALIAAFNLKDSLARRLLALTVVWLALFFGRETWGHLLVLAGIPGLFHLHRLQAAFELFAVLLAAWGLEGVIAAAIRAPRLVTIATGAVLAAAVLLLALDRAEFLRNNTLWGESNLASFDRERGDLEAALADVRGIIAERPGRVSAGQAADWGESFKIGYTPVYSLLSRYGLEDATKLYHTISRPSDYLFLRDQNNPQEEDYFAIRAEIAPVTLKAPSFFRRRSVHGRFAVYEVSSEGYFSLVDIAASYDGPPATWFDPIAKWLPSVMLRAGEVIALNSGTFPQVPAITRWQPIPNPNIQLMKPRGKIIAESKVGEIYRATIDVQRPCYAYIKITYFPSLVATVDGQRAPLIRVFPDFGAIPLTPGHHEVEVSYQPGPLKPLLFFAGILMFVLVARPPLGAYWERGEDWLRERTARVCEVLATDRAKTAIAMASLILLFTRALFRGLLIDGHDSLAYPPRLTEFAKIIGEYQIPPVWAPDLSNGHGQPLFEFFPPLAYITELPLYKSGLSLANSIQLPLIVLFAIGAIAVYLIGRRLSFSRFASVGAAAAWLFAPYQSIDVYVSVRVAESTAIALVPLALLALISVLDRPTLRRTLLSAPAIALIPLAHNAIALMMFPVFALIVLARAAISDRPLRTAAAGVGAIGGGLALSAFIWLPSMLEKGFVKTDLSASGLFHWTVHIISPSQLLWGRWGFGLSVAGPNDGMSFALGIFNIALAIAGLIVALRSTNRTRRVDASVFAVAALAGAFMSTEWSAIVWRHLSILRYLQFPWRMECLCALFMPLLALYLFESIGPKATTVAVVLLVLLNIQHTQPKGYLTYDDEFYEPPSTAERGLETTMYWAEPHWVQARLNYTGDGLIHPPRGMSVTTLSWTSTQHEYSVASPVDAGVMDSTDYFPGWTVQIDGHETAVAPAPAFGLLTFTIPAGRHDVTVEFLPTPIRHLASLISILAFIVFGLTFAVSNSGISLERLRDELALPRSQAAIVLMVGLIAAAAAGWSGIAGLFAGIIMLAMICSALAPWLGSAIHARDSRWILAAVILATIALVKIALLPYFPGFAGDLRLFTSWAQQITYLGPAHTYLPGFFLDYPPGYLYCLWVAGLVARALHASGDMLRVIVECPPLVADFFLAASIYALVRRGRSETIALIALLMVALNPALVFDTVVWGQCDSVLTLTMLASILALLDERYELGFAMAAISVLMKPQGLILLPVLVLWTLRHADRHAWVRCMLAFIAMALIGIAPFQIGHPWSWIVDLYASTAAGFQETSVNAFNLMALLGGIRLPDSGTIAGYSYYAVGMLLLVPLYGFVAWIVWTGRTARPLLFASFISIFGFFMLAPRMHERYIYPAIVLAAPLALEAPLMAAMFAILTLTALFNLAYVFRVLHTPSMLLDPRDGLAMATSAFNLVALTMAAYFGARSTPAQGRTPGTQQGAGTRLDKPRRKTAA